MANHRSISFCSGNYDTFNFNTFVRNSFLYCIDNNKVKFKFSKHYHSCSPGTGRPSLLSTVTVTDVLYCRQLLMFSWRRQIKKIIKRNCRRCWKSSSWLWLRRPVGSQVADMFAWGSCNPRARWIEIVWWSNCRNSQRRPLHD